MDYGKIAQRVVSEFNYSSTPFRWTSDQVLFGKSDAWRAFLTITDRNGQFARGDCDDFAWAALNRAAQLGVPLSALSMVYCNVVPDNGGSHRDGAHLVGMIGGFGNGPTYVMDCNHKRAYRPEEWRTIYPDHKIYWRDYRKLSWKRNMWRKIEMKETA